MKSQKKKRLNLKRRQMRVRRKVVGTKNRPRLAVFRSLSHIYAQLIDDATGDILAAVSTQQPKLASALTGAGNIEAAKAVGREIASVALTRGVSQVCFDRRGRKFHGRVKALADAAREGGLRF